jgi:hypothetical protein
MMMMMMVVVVRRRRRWRRIWQGPQSLYVDHHHGRKGRKRRRVEDRHPDSIPMSGRRNGTGARLDLEGSDVGLQVVGEVKRDGCLKRQRRRIITRKEVEWPWGICRVDDAEWFRGRLKVGWVRCCQKKKKK